MAFHQTFGTLDAADASGLRESVVRSWVERRHIVLSDQDRDAAGRGQTRLFTFETILQIAIAAELTRLGFASGHACRMARKFAHSGNPDRLPGRLFRDGKTLLVVRPGTDNAHVVRETDLADAFAVSGPDEAAVAIVDLNKIYRNTAARLRLPVEDVARL
ncbi:hypothetical protein [Pelagibacterium lacus]|uniref:MerR family transcriptional regulator n=1 Tax=Pelagibacterium lacus TaxID=2282655 RepID=A0A369W8P8_9HYPH|nr:hypothetical protein [Pelagibacterium lacus]RDE10349.1 hypothetical protein DVH29_02890 [Pelagibacterium lacus]